MATEADSITGYDFDANKEIELIRACAYRRNSDKSDWLMVHYSAIQYGFNGHLEGNMASSQVDIYTKLKSLLHVLLFIWHFELL